MPRPLRPAPGASTLKGHWCRARCRNRQLAPRLSLRGCGYTGGPALRDRQFFDAQTCKAFSNALGKVSICCCWLHRAAQNFTHLLFHRMAVAGSLQSQGTFKGIVEITDGQAGHVALQSDCNAGIVSTITDDDKLAGGSPRTNYQVLRYHIATPRTSTPRGLI